MDIKPLSACRHAQADQPKRYYEDKIETNSGIRFSIKSKLFIAIISIIMFISVTLVSYFVIMSKNELLKEIEKRGITEVKSLAYDAKYGVFTENMSILSNIIMGRLEKPDIAYIEIAKEDGTVLASGMMKSFLTARGAMTAKKELGDAIYRLSLTSEDGERIYQFVAPIKIEGDNSAKTGEVFDEMPIFSGGSNKAPNVLTTEIGSARIGISLRNMQERMIEILSISVLIVFLVVTVSVIISLILINYIVKPIKMVTQTAMEISAGDLSKTVEVRSKDEIGIMAGSFNKMTSSLKHTIEALEHLKKRLEVEVEKRTHELRESNLELIKANKELRQLDEMKTTFVSTVSHELRTPLTSILGFAANTRKFYQRDIIPRLPTGDKKLNKMANVIEDNLSVVVSEGERLTRLINNVLDIAKLEAGKIDWHIEEVDMVDICRQAISAVSGYPRSDRVEVVFEPPASSIRPVKADPDRLVQVITNLLSNAIKFTDCGKVVLKVEGNDDHIRVSITDTGKGISPHDLPRIFEKFRQVGDILTDKPRGTGLGLSICKEIIEQLGGTVGVESEAGKGSCFWFMFGYEGGMKKEAPQMPVLYEEAVAAQASSLQQEAGKMPALHEISRLAVAQASSLQQEAGKMSALHEISRLAVAQASSLHKVEDTVRRSVLNGSNNGENRLVPYTDTGMEGGRANILVVDDDANIRKLISQRLEADGYNVLEAKDGREAVIMAKGKEVKIDLILLDIMMPEIDGLDVLSILKNDAAPTRIPVIVVSVLEEQQMVSRLGVDAVFQKPIDQERLAACISSLLSSKLSV